MGTNMRPTTIDAAADAGLREWFGLSILVLPSLLLFMMLTMLFLAAPRIAESLEPTSTQMLWILDIYGFVMAGFLVAMGVLADRIGRRRMLMIGASIFGVASVAAAFSPTPEVMIAWRAILGLAAAMQMPATLGLIFSIFHNPKQRGVAIGIWAASISAGVAIGPLVSGLLLEAFSWQATFLVAAPVMAIVFVGAPLLLPASKDPHAGRFDLVSVALLLATLLPIIFGIKQFAATDGTGTAIAAIGIGLVAGLLFVIRQLRAQTPLLDVRLFSNPTISSALAVFMLSAAGLGGVYFMFAQHLQLVTGLSPFAAGLAILPAALLLVIVAMISPIIARRVQPGVVIAVGLAIQVIGYCLLTLVDSTTGLAVLIGSFMVLYPAVAPSMALTTDLVVGSVPPDKAGAASGLATTANDLGISFGIAVLGSLGLASYRSRMSQEVPSALPPEAAELASGSIGGALGVAAGLGEAESEHLADLARQAFAAGLNHVALIAAAVAVLAAIIAMVGLRKVPPTGQAL